MRSSDYRGDEPPPEGGTARGRDIPVEPGAGQRPRGGRRRSGREPGEAEHREQGRYEVRGEPPEIRRAAGFEEISAADTGEAEEMAAQHWGSPIIGMLAAAAGVVIFLTTFMSWLRGFTGWDLMTRSGFTGSGAANNLLWRVPPGRSLLVFTGFWSMLIGILMFVAGLLMIWRHRSGGSLATLFGAIGTAIGVWNIVNIYVLKTGFTVPGVAAAIGNVVPGIGVWLFAIISFVALIHGILGAEGVDNPSNDRLSYSTLPGQHIGRGRPAMR